MKKTILFAALIAISLLSTYYTHSMREDERERGVSISGEIEHIETSIKDAEALISQLEKEKPGAEPLIPEEQKKQKELEDSIAAISEEKTELESEIKEYEELATTDPRVLITLDDPVAKAKVTEVTRLCDTTECKQQAIFEYVRKEITYVTEGNPKEWKYPKSYLAFKFDFWQLPRETIEWRSGDCEDHSILLCTMMRIAGVPASDVKVMVGVIHAGGGMGGHAWVEFKMGGQWYVLESTCFGCNYIEKSLYYEWLSPDVLGWFNDVEYYEQKHKTTGVLASFAVV